MPISLGSTVTAVVEKMVMYGYTHSIQLTLTLNSITNRPLSIMFTLLLYYYSNKKSYTSNYFTMTESNNGSIIT